ncbi:MAG: FkbM family methyltransferase, partial [Oscillospiraceae bacterium]|nr:FkbM family methyltransferase [Oscillospiraceae bacterium]
IKVQTIDLDSFVNENNLPRIDFIKADIEGAERYMLMGAKQVLKDFAPKLSLCKYHLPDDSKVLKELILDANPNYVIEERWKKMYAYVPR